MYLDHFQLRVAPFSITPDTAFAFSSQTQRDAYDSLLLALADGAGFVKLTGEVGTGKTLTCRRFLAALGERTDTVTAYITNPCISPRALLLAILRELGHETSLNIGAYTLLNALNDFLLTSAAAGRRVVVCIDEAQTIPVETLEALRLVSNLETETSKLIQIVLFGQPELDRKLAQPRLRQLANRIAFQCTLSALSAAETERYLAHRLRVAGHIGSALFAPRVARLMHSVTRGVPRLLNIVAHKSLLLAFGEGALRVGVRHVRAAALDTPSAKAAGLYALWLARLGWNE